MDKDQILKLARSVNCEYEIGIWSEINSFMEYQNKEIIDFVLNFDEAKKCFCLKILITDYENEKIRKMFRKLVEFIEYESSTFYSREENDYGTEHFLLSTLKNKKSFLLCVAFIKSKENFYNVSSVPVKQSE